MANINHEDAIMKTGFEYFRDSILKMLGVESKFVDIGPTELVELTITKLYMDFTFYTADDYFAHFEFQTTDKKEVDLRRFRAYEAVLSHKQGKDVRTYVIYSGGMTDAATELKCGFGVYRVKPIYLNAKDADEILARLYGKQKNGETLSDEDIVQLSLTPVMCAAERRKEMIARALRIVKKENVESSEKAMAILYTFADKFLVGKDLDDIREVFHMTRLGQMIFDDGAEKGKETGKKQMNQLMRRLLDDHRQEDLLRCTEDMDFCNQLLKEYGIE